MPVRILMRVCWAYLKDLISFANLLHMHVLFKKNNQGVRITLVYCEVGAFLNLNLFKEPYLCIISQKQKN